VYEELGDLIDSYFVLNEPWCSSMLSYYLGVHAPGHCDMREALLAAHNLMLAQSEIVRFLRKSAPSGTIGTVLNFETAYAASPEPQDVEAARLQDGFFNRWFFDPLFLGAYPDDMLSLYEKWLPKEIVGEANYLKVGAELSSLGVNYYSGKLMKADPQNPLGFSSVIKPEGLTNDLNWPICVPPHYPSGLYDALQQIYYSYKEHGLRSLFITENGAAIYSAPHATEEPVQDARRVNYLASHLQQASDAIQRGIPLHGYFLWTLMDNYEWAEGYRDESRFGIIHVDRETMKRTPKQSYYWYKDLIAKTKAGA
jgi:beta-glucosidase